MSMKVSRELGVLHPLLLISHNKIQEVIERHNMPFRLFETGRSHSRHQGLLKKGKTKDLVSAHLFNLQNDPPLYTTALDYVYYNGKWSWNIRDSSIRNWYKLFGNLVLDICPELQWGGLDRSSTNYNHFQLRQEIVVGSIDKFPCTTF